MKVEYLRYFLAAASEGSFSEAGSKMHISPSSIGYAIDKLEEQLNTNLFVRIPSKGLSLTPDGIILQENAIKILDDLESILDIFNYAIQQIQVKKIDLNDPKYQYLFTVDSINALVMQGASFREAYQTIGAQVRKTVFLHLECHLPTIQSQMNLNTMLVMFDQSEPSVTL